MSKSHHPIHRPFVSSLVTGLLLVLLVAGCGTTPPASTATPTPLPPAAATTVPTRAATPAEILSPTATTAPTTPPTAVPSPTTPAVLPTATAAVFDPANTRIGFSQALSGLNDPVFATHAGDGSQRLFIVEKPGTIRILAGGELLDQPFLDIRDRVRSGGSEQGLLGLAFAPDYPTSGHLFVNYTAQDGRTVVARFEVSADANVADAASEFKVLEIAQPAPNHNGGMLAFGPDGYLWIGTGDGGAANDRFGNGQNPTTLLGKMLRLDVTSDPAQPYRVPPDNPWVTDTWNGQDVRDEVWAVGLRNPWRYSFDRLTGDLWVADVGQGTYEEINRIAAEQKGYPSGGLNFGWPIMEGAHCFATSAGCDRAGLVMPVAEYTHAEGGCSVTGGYVYRGTQFSILDGVYFYGDYCSGFVWALYATAAGTWQAERIRETGLSISSFGEDEAGEIYLTDLNGGLYRLVVE